MEINRRKILVIRIYSSSTDYDEMRQLHMKYDNSISIIYDDSLEKDWSIDLDEKIIKIHGVESLIPGILNKTLTAIEICLKEFDFDILVRSTMSTVIDVVELSSQLENLSFPIYGGHEWNLTWCDPKYNVTEEFRDSNWGLRFISGTSIVLSRDMCEYIINHRSEIDTNVVDDVAIGLLLKNVECNKFSSPFVENATDLIKNTCFYRCKNTPNLVKFFYERLFECGRTQKNIVFSLSNGN